MNVIINLTVAEYYDILQMPKDTYCRIHGVDVYTKVKDAITYQIEKGIEEDRKLKEIIREAEEDRKEEKK